MTTKDWRHPTVAMSQAMSGPVAAEPRVRPALVRPLGNAQCATGNQLEIVPPPITGKRGACAAPMRNRRAMRETRIAVGPRVSRPGTKPRPGSGLPRRRDEGERLPRAQDLAQDAARELEDRVAPGERREHQAELHLRQPASLIIPSPAMDMFVRST